MSEVMQLCFGERGGTTKRGVGDTYLHKALENQYFSSSF